MRIACAASLLIDGALAAQEQGELQITDYGISGIVIFQFSRLAAQALADDRRVCVRLDFKPDMPQSQLADYLYQRFHSIYHLHKPIETCLIGFLPEKMIAVMLKRSGISPGQICSSCSSQQTKRLANTLKSYKISIKGIKDFDFAQVTTGGIPVHEINADSMESRLVSGLYFSGEIIDVDAKCGGYNLQWAWSSGYAAGKHSRRYSLSK